MNKLWDSHTLAENLLDLMPKLRRIMSRHMGSLSNNEATLMQLGALYMLMEAPMTTSDLAKKRHVSLQAASTFVQGLVERGWVIRVKDSNDRRRSILEVTAEGKKQAFALRNQMTDIVTVFMDDLSPEEATAAEVFFKGLNRIMQEKKIEETP
jgi:DNA-binding MarR family transcriptional regulator